MPEMQSGHVFVERAVAVFDCLIDFEVSDSGVLENLHVGGLDDQVVACNVLGGVFA